jgi:putative toxin-antitoxin system antitoxin component (TIGR02293 family)
MLTAEDREEIKRICLEIAGETISPSAAELSPLVNVTARAIEVLGSREGALRWLKTPVHSLRNQTPLSLLGTAAGIAEVEDALGQIEHGVW